MSSELNALSMAIADSLWDQLDGDPDLAMTECGGWRKYTDAALALPHVQMLIKDAADQQLRTTQDSRDE